MELQGISPNITKQNLYLFVSQKTKNTNPDDGALVLTASVLVQQKLPISAW